MTPENFCYWLQGFLEIGNPKQLTEEQLEEVKNHLKLVFNKVTPIYRTTFDNEVIQPMVNETRFCTTHASC